MEDLPFLLAGIAASFRVSVRPQDRDLAFKVWDQD